MRSRALPTSLLTLSLLAVTLGSTLVACGGSATNGTADVAAASADDVAPTPMSSPVSTPVPTAEATDTTTLADPQPTVPSVPSVPSTVAPAEPAGPPDPCALVSPEEISTFLGGASREPERMDGRGGAYRSCDWILATDELVEVSLAVTTEVDAYNPAGWTRGEIVPVDGLGEQSYVSTDFGVRIGFVRAGLAVTIVSLGFVDHQVPTIDLARLVDARLSGIEPLPA